jgi:hypothetical protein
MKIFSLFISLVTACGCVQYVQSFNVARSFVTSPQSATTTTLGMVSWDLSGVSLNDAETLAVTAAFLTPVAVSTVVNFNKLSRADKNLQHLEKMDEKIDLLLGVIISQRLQGVIVALSLALLLLASHVGHMELWPAIAEKHGW